MNKDLGLFKRNLEEMEATIEGMRTELEEAKKKYRNVPDSSILLGEAEMNVQSLEIGIEEGWRAYDLMKKEEEGTPLEDDVREELLKIMETING